MARYGRNCFGKYVFNSLVIQLVWYIIKHFFNSMPRKEREGGAPSKQVKYPVLSLFFSIYAFISYLI